MCSAEVHGLYVTASCFLDVMMFFVVVVGGGGGVVLLDK